MYEYQIGKLTPEFIKDFDEYTSDKKFGIEFIGTKLPQMRTIPIAKSIQPQHNVSTFDEVALLMKRAEQPLAIVECICRQKKALLGKSLSRYRSKRNLPLRWLHGPSRPAVWPWKRNYAG